MLASKLDYTIFFRQLSEIPDSIEPLKASFYAGSMRSSMANGTVGLSAGASCCRAKAMWMALQRR